MKVTVLAGGTGSAKLLRGLIKIVSEKDLTVIVNVGDNFKVHGLIVCPDLDTVMYMFAGLLDKRRGWGVKGDTFNFQKMLKHYKLETWFNIGDMVLATHIYRTSLLAEGLTLT
ncbi:MAG: 2-phospho-L-lactate transferase CofD family protein, partial [Candidatus Bathyarchaeota archaeon]|nr:2-phospho-L-lactate transferase CofD family protein [Candidatus Bathyarchaeota archaeon]